MRFGNPECERCGHIHPIGFDCEKQDREDDMGIRDIIDGIARSVDAVPAVDRSKRVLTDGSPVTPDHRELKPNGQQKGYIVLSTEERARGFVKPVRRSYIHLKCGVLTTMGTALAETYARDPKFYSGTFCCGCGKHFTFGEPDGDFVWDGTNEKLGT